MENIAFNEKNSPFGEVISILVMHRIMNKIQHLVASETWNSNSKGFLVLGPFFQKQIHKNSKLKVDLWKQNCVLLSKSAKNIWKRWIQLSSSRKNLLSTKKSSFYIRANFFRSKSSKVGNHCCYFLVRLCGLKIFVSYFKGHSQTTLQMWKGIFFGFWSCVRISWTPVVVWTSKDVRFYTRDVISQTKASPKYHWSTAYRTRDIKGHGFYSKNIF